MKQKIIEAVAQEFSELKRTMFKVAVGPLGHNVPPAQGELLILVSKHQTLTVKAIAKEMRISSGAVTQLVDGLVALGLIERQPDKIDRRIVHIGLSQKGKNQIIQLRKKYMAGFETTMNCLTEPELETLLGILKKVNGEIATKG